MFRKQRDILDCGRKSKHNSDIFTLYKISGVTGVMSERIEKVHLWSKLLYTLAVAPQLAGRFRSTHV